MDRPQPGLPGGWASVTAVRTNLSGFEPTRTVRQEDTDSHTAGPVNCMLDFPAFSRPFSGVNDIAAISQMRKLRSDKGVTGPQDREPLTREAEIHT